VVVARFRAAATLRLCWVRSAACAGPDCSGIVALRDTNEGLISTAVRVRMLTCCGSTFGQVNHTIAWFEVWRADHRGLIHYVP
jgi:hypothetical protein